MNAYNGIYGGVAPSVLPLPLISSNPTWLTRLPTGLITPTLALPSHTTTPPSSTRRSPQSHCETAGRKGFSIAEILSEPSDMQRLHSSRTAAVNHSRAEPDCSYLPASASRDNHIFNLSQYFASAAVQPYTSSGPLLPRPLTVPLIPTAAVSHAIHTSPTPNISGMRQCRSKRVRTIFTPEQLEQLEKIFQKQQYMVGTERYYLASKLCLSEAQVKVWFQNRRIKWRKQLGLEQRITGSSALHSSSEFSDTCSESGFSDAGSL